VHERGRVYAAERSGAFGTVWIDAELAHHSQLAGEWSDALATADAVLETVRTTPHLMEMLARGVRGSIYAARGDLDAAVHELERMAAIARGSKDPQAIYPALAFYAETLLAAGRREEAGLMCDELFAVASDEPVYALEDWATALALTLRALGRLDELPALLAEAPPLGSPWRDAAEAVVAGDLVAAAEALRRAGDLARAATTRLVAAEDLLAEGRRREAEEQVRLAVEFHAAVGATAHLARAEALLAATSSS
jgi:tetratricopeptide (TPR) repeat protein